MLVAARLAQVAWKSQTALVLDDHVTPRHDNDMLIFKIFRADEWAHLRKNDETDGAPIDIADGYIHFSDANSVAKTAELYFADVSGLMLAAVEADGLDTLKWEESRGGTLFPHLFRKMQMTDVVWAKPLRIVDGVHQFPDLTT